MVITYYGLSCFKLQSGSMVLVVDPYSKESGLTAPRFQADIVLSTNKDPNHSNAESISGSPFIIDGPGEYEVKGIAIEGIASANTITIYTFEWDGIRFCHLGALPKQGFSEEVNEAIGAPDVLFVPVGGGEAMEAEDAVEVINDIEPRIVIPMYYDIKGLKSPKLASPSLFLKEFGSEAKPEDKFTFKAKDVPQEETKLVYLEAVARQ